MRLLTNHDETEVLRPLLIPAPAQLPPATITTAAVLQADSPSEPTATPSVPGVSPSEPDEWVDCQSAVADQPVVEPATDSAALEAASTLAVTDQPAAAGASASIALDSAVNCAVVDTDQVTLTRSRRPRNRVDYKNLF